MIETIALMGLEALFYGVMITAGIFVVMVVKRYNLYDEIATLVGAAEVMFQGTKLGYLRKEWVISELKKKFPSIEEEKVNKIIDYFVQKLTK